MKSNFLTYKSRLLQSTYSIVCWVLYASTPLPPLHPPNPVSCSTYAISSYSFHSLLFPYIRKRLINSNVIVNFGANVVRAQEHCACVRGRTQWPLNLALFFFFLSFFFLFPFTYTATQNGQIVTQKGMQQFKFKEKRKKEEE